MSKRWHPSFKLSAYADDTLCYLDGSVNSCRALFDDLGTFAKYSGLKPNIKKTQAFWVGKDADTKEPICSEFNMKWTNKLQVLGITFSNVNAHSVTENFENKLTRMKTIIASWNRRSLSLKGKIIIIKTLLLPLLTHVFTALPRPPNEFMKKLKTIFFQFIWNGKVDRIKRSSLYKPYLDGGMTMVDIDVYDTALKATWVRREITGNHDWCILFKQEIARGRFIWERNSSSLRRMARNTSNDFWAEVMLAMAQYDKSISVDIDDIGRHSVWFSNHTKFKNCEIKSWKQKGIVYINDLVKDNGELLSFEEAKNVYGYDGTMLDYLGLAQSLPIEWKSRQRVNKDMNPIIHPNIQSILNHKQGNKYIYNILLCHKYNDSKNTWESAWEQELGQTNWVDVYRLNKNLTSVSYQTLQCKILTKIIATNRLLYQIGRAESYRCERCTEGIDTIVHRFWSCPVVARFWVEVKLRLRDIDLIQNISVINKKVVILGCMESIIVNHIIIVAKRMIASRYVLSTEILFHRLKRDMQMERCIAIKKGEMSNYDNKWTKIAATLS